MIQNLKLPSLQERYQLITSSVAELHTKIEPETIDWIITDPPYPYKYIATFSELSALASKVIKPNGGLIVMSGQSYLPEILARLGEHMQYHWCCSYLTPGGQAAYNFPRKVNPFWKPILIYTKTGATFPIAFGDVIKTSANNNDKNFHFWGQSVEGFDNIVRRFTVRGQTILDPFVGGGTTGISALRNDRFFIGSDDDNTCIVKSEARIQVLFREMETLTWLFEPATE
jgi:site-specific DNA-methyltransferase (adenine-specific)